MKGKRKRLVNNWKGVSQQSLGGKFDKHQTTLSREIYTNRQIKKGINNYAREKTPKYYEKSALKAQKRSRKLVNLLYKSRAEVIMDDGKYFCFDGGRAR